MCLFLELQTIDTIIKLSILKLRVWTEKGRGPAFIVSPIIATICELIFLIKIDE